jgi:hypothetical protein
MWGSLLQDHQTLTEDTGLDTFLKLLWMDKLYDEGEAALEAVD